MKKLAFALMVAACLVGAVHQASADSETFEDDCSVSTWIKKPYSNSIELDSHDILLARGWQPGNFCALLNDPALNLVGVCQTSPGQTTPFTPWIPYSAIRSSSTGYFRWICGDDRERSRCFSGTTKVRFRLLGGDDEFQTQCSDSPL